MLLLRRHRRFPSPHHFFRHVSTKTTHNHKSSTPTNETVPNLPLLLDDDEKQGPSDSLRRIATLARPEASLILKSVATLGVTSSITLLIPSVCGQVIDVCLTDPNGVSPYMAAGGLLGLTAVAGAGVVLRSRWLAIAGNSIVARMRRQLFDATIAQDVAFFDRVPTGDLVTRLAADTQMIQRAATTQVVSAMRSVVMAAGGTACLMYTSPPLALVSLGTLPPILLAARYFGRVIRDRQKHVQELLSQSTTVAEETFSNVRTVRQFAAEQHESLRYSKKVEETYNEAVAAGMAQAWFDGVVHTAANGAILGVLGYGGVMVLAGDISAGDLASFLLYSMLVAGNVSAMSSTYADVMKAVGASGRVFAIIDRTPDMESVMDQKNNRSPSHVHGDTENKDTNPATHQDNDKPIPLSINFSNITFAYPLRPEINVLGPFFNLQVNAGESLALVGGSGSGKSTVAALLTRLYDVNKTEADTKENGVKVGGADVMGMDPRVLRETVGIVAQEPVLFATSILENIRYGKLSASDHEVEQAAKAARVLEFSDSFPEGLHTQVGSRGTQLSGGQKQRVAVARVILKDPPIVVFDEATSALDAESEHHVQKAIGTVMKGRTCVSIAHRLSTIREADRIAVLKDGVVVETGTFHELSTNKKSAFQELMGRQLQ